MIINNNFDTIIETEQIKNPLIPFFVEKKGEGAEQAIKVGILPGTVLFLATKQVFSPVKDVLYFNCVKDDCIYLNLTVGIKKSPVIVKINWKDPDVYINCVLEPEKDKFIKENEEQIKYAEKQIKILEQEIKNLQDLLAKGLEEINDNIARAKIQADGVIAEIIKNVEDEVERQRQIDQVNNDLEDYIETQERLREQLKTYYAQLIAQIECGLQNTTTTTTTTTAAPTESTTTTTTTTLAPDATLKCIETYKTIYKPIEYPKPVNIPLASICAWRKEIDRLLIVKKKIGETYNQRVRAEREDSIRYAKHNQFSINGVSISMSKEKEVKKEELSKESDTEVVNKFLLAKVEEIDKILRFTPTNFEFPQLIIKYGLGNEETQTFKNSETVNCVYPDVNKYTKIEFFLTSI